MRFSIEAEQSIIGGLLLNNQKFDDVLDVICADDFYHVDNKAIFIAMATLHSANKPFDVLTTADALQAQGSLDSIGGVGYLVEIANNTPGAANVMSYARIVADRAIERKFTEAGQRICEIGESAEISLDDKINQVHAEFSTLERNDRTEVKSFDELLKGEVQDIDRRFNKTATAGLMTGFADLDKRFGGIEPDDLWILAARPSMGKTTLAMNVACNVASVGKDVLIFSLEMGKEQLTKRLLSASSSIPYSVLREGNLQDSNWHQLSAGVAKLKGKRIHIVDIPSIDVNRAAAIARKYARGGNLGLIVIDYLQLMTAKSEDRFNEISYVSRQLKAIAKTVKAPVLALSQLSRKCEDRPTNKRPMNSDLRESGQIEQDADIISFIYRDEVYFKDSLSVGIAEVITSKFRNGETGTDYLASKLQFSRFENLAEGYCAPKIEAPVARKGFR